MIDNLKDIRDKDIKTSPLNDIIDIVTMLEEIEPHNYSQIEAIEDLSGYCELIEEIHLRIEHDEFEELRDPSQTAYKKQLVERLNKLRSSFASIVNTWFFYQNRLDTLSEEIKKQIQQIEQKIKDARDDAEKNAQENICTVELEIKEYSKTIMHNLDEYQITIQNDTQTRIASSERGLLTHTITLMGVFSAIITIVMSVVSTSSSWLNNADGASALLAFIVPTLTVTLSVSFLMLIIYAHNASSVFFDNQQKEKRKYYGFFFTILIVIIVGFSVLLWHIVLRNTGKDSELIHSRYVLSPGEYVIDASSSNGEDCYIFQIDGHEYVFAYDNSFEHNGCLYYCTDHNKLE